MDFMRNISVLLMILTLVYAQTLLDELKKIPECSKLYNTIYNSNALKGPAENAIAIICPRNAEVTVGDAGHFVLMSYDQNTKIGLELNSIEVRMETIDQKTYINCIEVKQTVKMGTKNIYLIDLRANEQSIPLIDASSSKQFLQNSFGKFYNLMAEADYNIYNSTLTTDVTFFAAPDSVFNNIMADSEAKNAYYGLSKADKLRIVYNMVVRGINCYELLSNEERLHKVSGGSALIHVDGTGSIELKTILSGETNSTLGDQRLIKQANVIQVEELLGFNWRSCWMTMNVSPDMLQFQRWVGMMTNSGIVGAASLLTVLKGESDIKPITMFYPNNKALEKIKDELGQFVLQPEQIYSILRDNILVGKYGMSDLKGKKIVARTLSEKDATIETIAEMIRVTVENTQVELSGLMHGASNGVLYQTSGLLSVKGTTVLDVINQNSLIPGFIRQVINKDIFIPLKKYLDDGSKKITMFIPSQESINKMLQNVKLKDDLFGSDELNLSTIKRLIIDEHELPLTDTTTRTFTTKNADQVTIKFNPGYTVALANGPAQKIDISAFSSMDPKPTNGVMYQIDGFIMEEGAGKETGDSNCITYSSIVLLISAIFSIIAARH